MEQVPSTEAAAEVVHITIRAEMAEFPAALEVWVGLHRPQFVQEAQIQIYHRAAMVGEGK
jgi:hypothetical protein